MKPLLLLLFFLSQSLYGSVLRDIESGSDEEKTVTTISFDKILDGKPEMKNEGSFIEVILRNVTVEQPGTFYDAKSPFFTKIAPFQLNNNDAAIRFFVKESKLHIEKALKIEKRGEALLVELNHKALSTKSDLADSTMPSASEVISKTKVRNNIKDPVVASSTENNINENTSVSKSKTDSLKNYLNIGAGLGAIAMFIFLGISFYKNRSGDISDIVDSSKATIKTLASYPISQKQQLKLIEVAGEKILLGVNGDNISYLKTIEENSSISEIPSPTVNERKPLQLEQMARQTLPQNTTVKPRSLNTAYKSTKHSTVEKGSENIAMKMLSKNDGDFSDVANVEIKSTGKAAKKPAKKVSSKKPKMSAASNDKAVEDVTKLIRKKLQNLPKV